MTHPVCIFGPPADSRELIDTLLAQGRRVLLAPGPDPQHSPAGDPAPPAGLEVLPPARLVACRGESGDFMLEFAVASDVMHRRASALVLAHPPERLPNFAACGLRPSPAVRSASDLRQGGCRPPAGTVWTEVAILNGLCSESSSQATGELLQAALRLRLELDARCHFFTGNLKVAADGLEALAREARTAGVAFHKFTHSAPVVAQNEDGKAQIVFTDEITGVELRLAPDLVVVDEALEPAGVVRELARTLELETDAAGFPQADLVHRLPVFTNRRGVLVAGTALPLGAEAAADAANLLLALRPPAAPAAAQIDPGRCVRCLTCYRVCPYRAVSLRRRPEVLADACEGCGICRAECPRQAIRISGLEPAEFNALLGSERSPTGRLPRLTVLACSRSGGPAVRAAAAAGPPWAAQVTLVEVPCAGSLGPEFLLAAFARGADGVMVLACHDELCHGRTGNRLAAPGSSCAAAAHRASCSFAQWPPTWIRRSAKQSPSLQHT
ncbi:MAG: hydrogenase iron-sulfur subunit [Desulfobacterales bacterium]|nr:hydrogenase iron-sulfur subunit [Desulfobacterales bacterium]